MTSSVPRFVDFPPQQSQQQGYGGYSQAASARGAVGSGEMIAASAAAAAAASEAQLHSTLSRMALYVRKTRLQIQPFFADFDRHRSGAISYAQFARVLATVGFTALTHDLVENLSAHYALPNDPTKVSYKSFIADIDEIASAQQTHAHDSMQRTQAGPTLDWQESQVRNPLVLRQDDRNNTTFGASKAPFIVQHDIHAESPLTAAKLLHKIQTVAQQKRIILSDIFADFDSLRKNLITLQRFRRCLDVAGFSLSDSEANTLVLQYLNERDPSQVEYKRFVADVLAPFIPSNPESQPQSQLAAFEPYRLEEHETPQPHFEQEDLDRIEFLLKQIGYETHTRRILVKPGFQHHDSTRSGCVTARQFASVVTATFPFRFQPRDLELLCAKYRRSSVGICYTAFIKDVELQELGAGDYAKTLHPSHAATHLLQQQGPPMVALPRASGGANLVAGMQIVSSRAALQARDSALAESSSSYEVLGRIRASLARKRMTVEDIFADFDNLNKGRVTRPQFFRCLALQGLQLSPQDVHTLTESYPHSEFPLEVDYKRFVSELSTIPRF